MPSEIAQISKGFVIGSLAREQFDEWDALVTRSPHGTVFHYSWYLSAVTDDFNLLGYWDEKGKLVAGIPLPRKRRAGLVLYHPPLLTPYLGPVFDFSEAESDREKLSLMRHRGEQLAQAINGFDSLYYACGASASDLQGFLWAGFRAELAYTFRFDAGTTPDAALEDMARTHRQKLRKHEQYIIETGEGIGVLAALSNQTFARQGISCPFNEALLHRLWNTLSKRNRATLYTARDLAGRPVSSLFVVHDDRTSYQIVSGINISVRDSPAGYLLTWRAICDALTAGRAFDFEGSRLRGVEQYYRRWGAPARPVWKLKKAGSVRGWLASTVFHGFNGVN